jgi:spermidine/putrescine transport system ATP-binding protein
MNTPKVSLRHLMKDFGGQEKSQEGRVRAVDDLTLDVADGEFFALLGPSGCGKTTTLRLIAGFEQPDAGEVWIDDKPMHGIPAFERPVNTVFQDYVLFPHMSVLQNVMFGLQMARIPKREAEARAHEALEMVKLPKMSARKPRELSGGQQQRVALARAIVNRPAVLLLDEPLGALDLKLRRDMQEELKTLQRDVGITFVYVTHDQEEALTMADRIGVMHNGRLLQVGTPAEIYELPATRFVADFIGETNFLTVRPLHYEGRLLHVALDDETPFPISLYEQSALERDTLTVALRPERIALAPYDATSDSPTVVHVKGQITHVQYIGTDTRYTVRVGETLFKVRVQNALGIRANAYQPRDHVSLFWERDSAQILLD